MKRMIAAMQVSLDGFIEGPRGELDWVADWEDDFRIRDEVDICVLGGGMYPGYEQYWTAILADPTAVLEFTDRPPTLGEIDYANWADNVRHLVVSSTLPEPTWQTSSIVRDIDQLRDLKQEGGKDIFVVGGATLVSSLMNLHLIDELRLVLHPLVLGGGTALFKDVNARHPLKLRSAEPTSSGHVLLTYDIAA